MLIDRTTVSRTENPLEPVLSALASGYSLIFFPEGTRNTSSQALLPFKSGLFRLAQAFPNVQLIPVWVDNIGRVLPKGEVFPVPLLCSVTFGVPVIFEPSESKTEFLARARSALLMTSPHGENGHAP